MFRPPRSRENELAREQALLDDTTSLRDLAQSMNLTAFQPSAYQSLTESAKRALSSVAARIAPESTTKRPRHRHTPSTTTTTTTLRAQEVPRSTLSLKDEVVRLEQASKTLDDVLFRFGRVSLPEFELYCSESANQAVREWCHTISGRNIRPKSSYVGREPRELFDRHDRATAELTNGYHTLAMILAFNTDAQDIYRIATSPTSMFFDLFNLDIGAQDPFPERFWHGLAHADGVFDMIQAVSPQIILEDILLELLRMNKYSPSQTYSAQVQEDIAADPLEALALYDIPFKSVYLRLGPKALIYVKSAAMLGANPADNIGGGKHAQRIVPFGAEEGTVRGGNWLAFDFNVNLPPSVRQLLIAMPVSVTLRETAIAIDTPYKESIFGAFEPETQRISSKTLLDSPVVRVASQIYADLLTMHEKPRFKRRLFHYHLSPLVRDMFSAHAIIEAEGAEDVWGDPIYQRLTAALADQRGPDWLKTSTPINSPRLLLTNDGRTVVDTEAFDDHQYVASSSLEVPTMLLEVVDATLPLTVYALIFHATESTDRLVLFRRNQGCFVDMLVYRVIFVASNVKINLTEPTQDVHILSMHDVMIPSIAEVTLPVSFWECLRTDFSGGMANFDDRRVWLNKIPQLQNYLVPQRFVQNIEEIQASNEPLFREIMRVSKLDTIADGPRSVQVMSVRQMWKSGMRQHFEHIYADYLGHSGSMSGSSSLALHNQWFEQFGGFLRHVLSGEYADAARWATNYADTLLHNEDKQLRELDSDTQAVSEMILPRLRELFSYWKPYYGTLSVGALLGVYYDVAIGFSQLSRDAVVGAAKDLDVEARLVASLPELAHSSTTTTSKTTTPILEPSFSLRSDESIDFSDAPMRKPDRPKRSSRRHTSVMYEAVPIVTESSSDDDEKDVFSSAIASENEYYDDDDVASIYSDESSMPIEPYSDSEEEEETKKPTLDSRVTPCDTASTKEILSIFGRLRVQQKPTDVVPTVTHDDDDEEWI